MWQNQSQRSAGHFNLVCRPLSAAYKLKNSLIHLQLMKTHVILQSVVIESAMYLLNSDSCLVKNSAVSLYTTLPVDVIEMETMKVCACIQRCRCRLRLLHTHRVVVL